ncbi:DUF2624 domain-containing protein [Bacillaceae bacterium S4-13-58]
MNKFIKQIVQQKLKNITPKQLVEYSREYDIPITQREAENILNIANESDLDPFDENDRLKIIKKVAKVTDMKRAQAANKLFLKLMKENNLDKWI